MLPPMLDFRNPESLAAARQSAGLSVEELARRSGLSRDTIERIERGRTSWRLATFSALEGALRVDTAA